MSSSGDEIIILGFLLIFGLAITAVKTFEVYKFIKKLNMSKAKKVALIIASAMFVVIIIFAAFAFFAWNMNPSGWHEDSRAGFSFMMAFIGVVAVCLSAAVLTGTEL